MSYWDTSALVKLYVPETDSTVFEQHARENPTSPVIARLATWEARATFCRKESEGAILPGTATTVHSGLLADIGSGEWRVIEFGPDVEAEFGRVLEFCWRQNPPLFIRTLDAIQLASAAVSRETELVATDKRLREAAMALGFTLFPK